MIYIGDACGYLRDYYSFTWRANPKPEEEMILKLRLTEDMANEKSK